MSANRLAPRKAPGLEIPQRALVVGFARTGQAVARVLGELGVSVVALDDHPPVGASARAGALGVELVERPSPELVGRLGADAELVVVSPGVPPGHPVFAATGPVRPVSEIELAYRLAEVPIVAVTGTNGKTTVASLVAEMLVASGVSAAAAGNIGYPLVEAVRRPGLEVVVAEVSSFQLALIETFRPSVATWLNLAEDHLDWHGDLDHYVRSKARIWANQEADDVAVANAEDPVVAEAARAARGRVLTFGLAVGDYRRDGGRLVGPDGRELVSIAELSRDLPHDVTNALAALATAVAAGATADGCTTALRNAKPLAHRVELVGRVGDVAYYDDSKATTPSAVAAALAGFEAVVLIAGGRNKGLDLGALRRGAEAGGARRVRAVVAIGEAAAEVAAAFDGYTVVGADSMQAAAAEAQRLARPGDAVLLSPGCASFDWYASYEERGQDFVRAVRRLGVRPADGSLAPAAGG
ncbi:MAG TPA: UDP-N-acetylmuramoyl-L-alanine--D-glutamate ligase [Acidimicrobiales bacterium]|nr:UDP-N-acetylmuramoyl-L-alanine--D-glutamate ligase [Acidimicrobiales bacterium]